VSGQVSEHVSGHQDTRTPKHVNTRTPEHVNTWTPEQVDNRTPEQVNQFDIHLKPKDLNLNQYRVLYEIYFKRPFKIKGPKRIGSHHDFPIAYGTVRNALRALYKKNYISKHFSINDGVHKGSSCQVNENKCFPLFGHTNIINSEQVNTMTPGHLNKWTPEHQNK